MNESETRAEYIDPKLKVSGKDNEIVLNHKYLLDGLQNIGSDEIVISVIDGSSPCIIKPKDSTEYMYIIMPIKQ